MNTNLNLRLMNVFAAALLAEFDLLNGTNESQSENQLFNLREKVKEFETKMIKAALVETAGNQRRAAQLLGVKVTTLHNKIKTYDIKLKLTPANF